MTDFYSEVVRNDTDRSSLDIENTTPYWYAKYINQ